MSLSKIDKCCGMLNSDTKVHLILGQHKDLTLLKMYLSVNLLSVIDNIDQKNSKLKVIHGKPCTYYYSKCLSFPFLMSKTGFFPQLTTVLCSIFPDLRMI